MDKYDPEWSKPDITHPTRLPRACIYATKLILYLVLLLALIYLGFFVLMASVVFLVPDVGPRPVWATILVLAMWVVYLTAIVRTGLKTGVCVEVGAVSIRVRYSRKCDRHAMTLHASSRRRLTEL